MTTISVHVNAHGLADKFGVFTERGAKAALRKGARRAGARGRTLTRAGAPVKTGIGKRGIKSTSRSAGLVAIAKVYPSGPHAHIMKWQDRGTGFRHKKNGQSTGRVGAQFFFERASIRLDDELEAIFDSVVNDALRSAGLL